MYSILNMNNIFESHIGPCLNRTELCNFKITSRLARDNVDQVRHVDSTKPINCSISQWLKVFPSAITINLSGRINITDNDFVQNQLHNIQFLDISDCPNITDAALVNLNLKSLNIRNSTGITDAALLKLKNLEHLNISNCPNITDEGLRGLSKLKYLNMSGTPNITDQAFVNLKNLKTLIIKECGNITDLAFEHLINLEHLDMSYCKQDEITDEAFLNLKNIKTINMRQCTQSIIGIYFKYFNNTVNIVSNYAGEFRDPEIIKIMNLRIKNILKNKHIIHHHRKTFI